MTKNTVFIYALIILIAGGLRIGLGWTMKDSFMERGNRYSTLVPTAKNVSSGNGFVLDDNQPTAINEPVYVVVLAAIIYIFGYHWLPLLLFQFFLSIVSSWIVYKLAYNIYNNTKVALIAAGLFLMYPFYITQSISVVDSTVFIFLLVLYVYNLYMLKCRHSSYNIIALGVIVALIVLTRQGAISIIIGGMFGYALVDRNLIKSLKSFVFVGIIALVVMSPWLVRNYSYTQKLFISTHGAVELWFGYNDSTDAVISRDVSVDIMRRYSQYMVPDTGQYAYYYNINPLIAEYKDGEKYTKAAFGYIKENPVDVLKMMPLKLWKFWSWKKNPSTNSLNNDRNALSLLWDKLYTIYYVPLLLLGLAGFVRLCIESKHAFWIIIGIISSYSFMHMMVYGFTRLRTPLDVFLIISASGLVVYVCMYAKLAFNKFCIRV
jgi:4-amino-4-deoxy-L-arabinose transferase-like glycosyltransferase